MHAAQDLHAASVLARGGVARSYNRLVPSRGPRIDLPPAVWLLPSASAVAGVLAWTVWSDAPDALWIGAIFIAATGLLTFSFVLEGLPHARGWSNRLRRAALASLCAVAAAALAGGAAFLGLYLRRPFF
jgi:hypothetical protein